VYDSRILTNQLNYEWIVCTSRIASQTLKEVSSMSCPAQVLHIIIEITIASEFLDFDTLHSAISLHFGIWHFIDGL
jgi:hypothetical protein